MRGLGTTTQLLTASDLQFSGNAGTDHENYMFLL
jgi:hypothetical protein